MVIIIVMTIIILIIIIIIIIIINFQYVLVFICLLQVKLMALTFKTFFPNIYLESCFVLVYKHVF